MPYWIVGGKNLYYGICSWPPEDEGKKKSARWGKISTLAPISKNLENDVLTAICTGASEDEVIDMIRPISKRIKRGDVKLSEVASTTRLQKSLSAYSATTGGAVKGARYFNEHLATTDKYGEGDSVNWVYVVKAPDHLPPTDVVVYQKETDLDGFDLDYDKMVDKLVKQKMKGIFGALDWNLEFASGAAQPKKYW
jgi:DNA polymerase elongation subunit (family B)